MGCNVRFLNACPGPRCLDIYTNNQLLKDNCSYKYLSDYTNVDSGDHSIKVYKSGNKHYPILNAYTKLMDTSCHTIIASGQNSDMSLFLVPDAHVPVTTAKAFLRFVNLADSPDLDFTFTDGAFIMVNDIEYKEATQYYPVTPGTYTVKVYISGTKQLLTEVPNFTLRRGRSYTLYVLGLMSDWNLMGHIVCSDGINWS
ncbi:MAG: hypothetical protein VR72_12160 [Clostridiaceae bacterium BRH_c20a]|nr:MAG: hypothetical protein VR72_12160 [Clostridiaceae bacterium BRH_c20a]